MGGCVNGGEGASWDCRIWWIGDRRSGDGCDGSPDSEASDSQRDPKDYDDRSRGIIERVLTSYG